jgi:hypothetical protein
MGGKARARCIRNLIGTRVSGRTKHYLREWRSCLTNSTRLRVALTPGNFEGKPHFLVRTTDGIAQDSAVVSTFESRFGVPAHLDEADIALFPFDLSDVLGVRSLSSDALTAIIDSNRERGLRTVCVMRSDYSRPLRIGQPHALILRSSMIRGLDYTEEFPIPTNFGTNDLDLYADPGCGYSARPRIGFMGSVPRLADGTNVRLGDDSTTISSGFEKTDALADQIVRTPMNIGTVIRNRGLATLRKSRIIDADIVTRDVYFGFYPADERTKMRGEYVEHMMRNDYIFCPRGAGNYSTRLFETVAAGRIPILIDTNLVMPFADVIPWQEIAVWVPINETDRLDEHVLAFHARLGDGGYWALKTRLRKIFESHLSRDGVDQYLESFLMERR